MNGRRVISAFLCFIVIITLTTGLVLAGCGEKKEEDAVVTTAAPEEEKAEAAGEVLLVLPNNDFNDTEYTTTRSVLVEEGLKVDVANTSGLESVGLLQTTVTPDVTVDKVDVEGYAAAVFIGGPGASNYFDDAKVQQLAKDAASGGKVVAAICVAPVILANAGVLQGKNGTVFPAEKENLTSKGCNYQDAPCVVDGDVITANGPEASQQFAEAIVEALEK